MTEKEPFSLTEARESVDKGVVSALSFLDKARLPEVFRCIQENYGESWEYECQAIPNGAESALGIKIKCIRGTGDNKTYFTIDSHRTGELIFNGEGISVKKPYPDWCYNTSPFFSIVEDLRRHPFIK